MINRENRIHNILIITIITLIIGYMATFAIINFYGFTTFLDADMYSDTLVAKYMWDEKTIFPDNWVFGNQYYVIATPVLSALFYGFTGSMNISMALATTSMTILIILTLILAIRPYLKKYYCLLTVLALLSSTIGFDLGRNHEAQLFFNNGKLLCLLPNYRFCYIW